MARLPFSTWIANAAAVLVGSRGNVSKQAELSGCSRQSAYHHSKKVLTAVQAECSEGPTRDQLVKENQQLRDDNARLWDWLAQTIEFPAPMQNEFAITATAMGLSLCQITTLLAIVLGAKVAPSRSAIHRTILATGCAAGKVLKRLDERCKALVLTGCLDEIFFHGRPVLVGIEPQSMVWFLGARAENCQGATWCMALRPWTSLEYVVADAGVGLHAGVAQIREEQRGKGVPQLQDGLDVFHTALEAQRVLSRLWRSVERSWENAEAAAHKRDTVRRGGAEARKQWDECAKRAWSNAEQGFQEYETTKSAWKSVQSALQIVRPDGVLNDRDWASRQFILSFETLAGPEWAKVRSLLQAPGALAFLDRLHQQLREAEPNDDLREELLRLWRLRRQRPRGSHVNGGAGHVAHLVQMAVCHKLDAGWSTSYAKISRVIRQAVRASSAAECLNSMLRMHQSRHRTVTQGLLDLKRLYWNSRPFSGGKRKGHCPYEHLGLKLPSFGFMDLLSTATEAT